MKHWSITAIIIVALSIIGCGGGGSGGGVPILPEENLGPIADTGPDQTVDEGVLVTLDGSKSSDPDDGIASYQWSQTDGLTVTLSDPTAVQPTFTAPDVGLRGAILKFELTVTDKGGLYDTDDCVVKVVDPKEQTQAVLYTAYAGIGYMSKDDPDDNEALYDVMFDDLNSLVGYLSGEICEKYPFRFIWDVPSIKVKGIEFLDDGSGSPRIPGVKRASLKIILENLLPWFWTEVSGNFTATLEVEFNGYHYNNCIYYGHKDMNHLEVELSGDYMFVKESSSEDSTICIRNVVITASDSLMVQYKDDEGQNRFKVQYNNLGISYEVLYGADDPERNIGFIYGFIKNTINGLNKAFKENFEKYGVKAITNPIHGLYPDNRDYTLNGSFRINDDSDSHSFFDFRYRQLDIDQPEEYITLQGGLSVPALGGHDVEMITPGADIVDLFNIEELSGLPDNVIIRDTGGLWTSGKMTITSANSVNVEFNNGSAEFTADFDPYNWTESDWQDTLDLVGP